MTHSSIVLQEDGSALFQIAGPCNYESILNDNPSSSKWKGSHAGLHAQDGQYLEGRIDVDNGAFIPCQQACPSECLAYVHDCRGPKVETIETRRKVK